MIDLPRDLKSLYREGRLVPFVGAGASMSVEWVDNGKAARGVSWSQLVDQAILDLGIEIPDLLRVRGSDLQILEYYKSVKGNFSELQNWMVRNFNPPDEALRTSRLHNALSSLVKSSLFYTTNFDFMLERAFGLAGRKSQVVATPRDTGFHRQCEIVKFHGDLNNPDAMVLSESDYQRRMSLSAPMDYKLRSDLMNRAALFVGYSFSDPNVSYLFRTMDEVFGHLANTQYGRRAYIIIADPSEFEQRLFSARNMDIIAISSRDRAGGAAEVLESLARL